MFVVGRGARRVACAAIGRGARRPSATSWWWWWRCSDRARCWWR